MCVPCCWCGTSRRASSGRWVLCVCRAAGVELLAVPHQGGDCYVCAVLAVGVELIAVLHQGRECYVCAVLLVWNFSPCLIKEVSAMCVPCGWCGTSRSASSRRWVLCVCPVAGVELLAVHHQGGECYSHSILMTVLIIIIFDQISDNIVKFLILLSIFW